MVEGRCGFASAGYANRSAPALEVAIGIENIAPEPFPFLRRHRPWRGPPRIEFRRPSLLAIDIAPRRIQLPAQPLAILLAHASGRLHRPLRLRICFQSGGAAGSPAPLLRQRRPCDHAGRRREQQDPQIGFHDNEILRKLDQSGLPVLPKFVTICCRRFRELQPVSRSRAGMGNV